MSPLTKDTEEKQFHMSEILGNFPSIKTCFFSSLNKNPTDFLGAPQQEVGDLTRKSAVFQI